MSKSALVLDNISKQYTIGQKAGYRTLRESLATAFQAPLRLFRGAGRSKDGKDEKDGKDHFLALQDVSFDVAPGQVVGIIGRNGAGKSTLLKVVSRITEPTTGRVTIRGRVASLLEVGTGFHPELTGRENVFLNGAILGMRRAEIKRKFDEIVAFAEVEKFLDTPVKRYSSGMYVRLAFAVAAHLESEILIIDEVLAVGDAAFQKKCLTKMSAVAREHRTVLFVSHNMNSVRALCTRGIILDRGQVVANTTAQEAANSYMKTCEGTWDLDHIALGNRMNRTNGAVRFTSFRFEDEEGNERSAFQPGQTVRMVLTCKAYRTVPSLSFDLSVRSGTSLEWLTYLRSVVSETQVNAGEERTLTLTLPQIPLFPGDYPLYLRLGNKEYDRFYDVIDHNVSLPNLTISASEPTPSGDIGYFSIPWSINVER
jgi:lipopolysaccharide transport system ATP-binding protein